MKKRLRLKTIIRFLFITVVFPCTAQVNNKATKSTHDLYHSLFEIRKQGVIFGHQDAMAYGLNQDGSRWIASETMQSDIGKISGKHPGLLGWDLGHIEIDKQANLDGVNFEFMKKCTIEAYQNGIISTYSWHPNNPLDFSKSTWDKMENTIGNILNKPDNLKNYLKTLDKLAVYFKSLKSENGQYVPVIFRPYHEHTGSWFWWGADHCTPQQYKDFWIMTYNYLTNNKKVNHLLWAYSTDNFKDDQHYLERFPGYQYVDILGFDTYHRNAPQSNQSFVENAQRMVNTIKNLAEKNNKLFAITETGLETVSEKQWWSKILSPVVSGTGLSYVLLWRNGRPDHYYAPYKGQKSEPDFLETIKGGVFLLQSDFKISPRKL